MDTEKLIAHARSRFDHETAKRVLKEKYHSKMIFAHAGGLWQAGPELLILLETVPVEDSVVIPDLYGNPVRVNPSELKYLAFERWQEQMNGWLEEYEQTQSQR